MNADGWMNVWPARHAVKLRKGKTVIFPGPLPKSEKMNDESAKSENRPLTGKIQVCQSSPSPSSVFCFAGALKGRKIIAATQPISFAPKIHAPARQVQKVKPTRFSTAAPSTIAGLA
jgi:hypothetical protein